MHTFLVAESDSICKRNAFVFLAHCSIPKAVEYILSIYDSIGSLDEALQMSIIEVIQLDCKNDSAHRVRVFFMVFLNYWTHFNSSQGISVVSSMLPRTL